MVMMKHRACGMHGTKVWKERKVSVTYELQSQSDKKDKNKRLVAHFLTEKEIQYIEYIQYI